MEQPHPVTLWGGMMGVSEVAMKEGVEGEAGEEMENLRKGQGSEAREDRKTLG